MQGVETVRHTDYRFGGKLHPKITCKNYLRWCQICIQPGRTSVPEIFFNDHLIGGSDDLQKLEDEGKLDHLLKECLDVQGREYLPIACSLEFSPESRFCTAPFQHMQLFHAHIQHSLARPTMFW